MDDSLGRPGPVGIAPAEDDEDIVHYAFESDSQLDQVQEEVILDGPSASLDSQQSLVSTSLCNPVVKEDSSCVDLVLVEEIVTDTQHHVGEDDEELDMSILMDVDFSAASEVPADKGGEFPGGTENSVQSTLESRPGQSCDSSNSNGATTPITNNNEPVTTSRTLSSSSSSTLPIVKIVPTANSNKIVMKIQAKEPPDLNQVTESTLIAQDTSSSTGNGVSIDEDPEDDLMDDELEAEELAEEVEEQEKSRKATKPKTIDTSMDLLPVDHKTRKSRKAVGRPRKKQLVPVAAAAAVAASVPVAEHESPKRQSTRALAANEAAQKRRAFSEVGGAVLDTTDGGEMSGLYDADEASLDYHSDNETNESVASGGTDSLPMKLPKASSNSNAAVVPAPKVSGG